MERSDFLSLGELDVRAPEFFLGPAGDVGTLQPERTCTLSSRAASALARAGMVMTALAWSMKAWLALLLPVSGRWGARYREEQRTPPADGVSHFPQHPDSLPAQVIRTGRKIVLRVMAYNSWMPVLFRGIDALRALRC